MFTQLLKELREDTDLLAIFLGIAFIMCSNSFVRVVFPLFLRSEFDANYLMVNLLSTVFAVARLFTNIPLSIVIDRVGRKRLMMTGPVLIFISICSSGLASSYHHLLVLRALEGLGSAMFMTSAIITIVDIAPRGQRGSYMGWYLVGLHLGMTVGPVLGGIVNDLLGFRAPFLIGSVFSIFGTLVIKSKFQKTESLSRIRNQQSVTPQKLAVKPVLEILDREVVIIMMVSFCVFFVRTGILQGLFPLYANEEINLSTALIGTITTLGTWTSTVILLFGRKLSDRYGRKRILILGLASYSIGMFITVHSNSFLKLLLTNLVIAFSTSIISPIPVAFLGDKVSQEIRSKIIGIHRTIGDIGMILGPIAMGWVSDTYDLKTPFILASGYLLLTMSLCFAIRKVNTQIN
jgi:MFS family permease